MGLWQACHDVCEATAAWDAELQLDDWKSVLDAFALASTV